MRKFFLIALLTSCTTSFISVNQFPVIVIDDDTGIYNNNYTISGRLATVSAGDTLFVVAHGGFFYKVIHDTTYGYVKKDEVLTLAEYQLRKSELEYLAKVKGQLTRFKIDKEKSEDAWARAQTFIGRYSSMKLQIATDYVLQTYNPTSIDPDFGYYVTRTPINNEYEFDVECTYSNMFSSSDASLNAKILSYYILTGDIQEGLIKK